MYDNLKEEGLVIEGLDDVVYTPAEIEELTFGKGSEKPSNSYLVDYVRISPNSTNPRTSVISKITIHHMAGNLSVEACGNIFASSSRQASSNYGIGSDGRVGMYVEEKNRSWCSNSRSNDMQAVTIEVANDSGADNGWHISDKAYAKLIDLCTDICLRNDIDKLVYTGDIMGNVTTHNMFINTTCPGAYILNRLQDIVRAVNERLLQNEEIFLTYQVYDNNKKRWLNNIVAGEGTGILSYAGNFGNTIGGVKIDKLRYRVHDRVKNKWLNWIVGRDGVGILGYAGNLGNPIDGLQVSDAIYRVHLLNGGWLSWISKVDDTPQGYAGILGRDIDAIQLRMF